MEGIALVDRQGRTFLSTHFRSSLSANTAIQAALASSYAVVYVQGGWGPTDTAEGSESSGEEDDEQDEGWKDRQQGGGRGTAVCQIERGGVRYVAPVASDVDPLVPLTFLTELYSVLCNYIAGPVTEASIKDHFDIVLALLQEMVSSGRPQLSQSSQLRDLVHPPSELLTKVALNAVSAAGLSIPTQATASALLSSPIPWRRQGIKYTSNEIYLDLTETLTLTLLPSGAPLAGTTSISGSLDARTRLSGMPDLALTFVDSSVLDEPGAAAFHSCVRWGRWNKEKVVSFVPPDGAFQLLSFHHLPRSTSPALTLALLPFSLLSSYTLGSSGAAFSLTLTARASSSLINLELRLPLVKGANGVQATVQGGAWVTDDEGRTVGGGAGRWDVVIEPGEGGKKGERQYLVWKIEKLAAGDRPAVLSGQYFTPPGGALPPSFSLTFDTPSSSFSGLRVDSLKLVNEAYNLYKGVKSRGRARVEVRTRG
ncbi:hypothetical protein JCM8097_001960 [Rhodosporidiobolus ruineniae]